MAAERTAAADEDPSRRMDSPTWSRLEEQLAWYDAKSQSNQTRYKRVKIAQLVIGALVPVFALAPGVHPLATATLAAVVVILEGLQQLSQWQTNWVLYRSTAEALKHEKYLFLAAAGPYRRADRVRVLAERVEGLVSQEHAKWTEASSQDEPAASRQG